MSRSIHLRVFLELSRDREEETARSVVRTGTSKRIQVCAEKDTGGANRILKNSFSLGLLGGNARRGGVRLPGPSYVTCEVTAVVDEAAERVLPNGNGNWPDGMPLAYPPIPAWYCCRLRTGLRPLRTEAMPLAVAMAAAVVVM